MKTVFCSECEEKVKADIVQKEETFTVKGEKISIPSSVLVCSKCKHELFDEELDGANLAAAYNEYRTRHSLLLPLNQRPLCLGKRLETLQEIRNLLFVHIDSALVSTPLPDVLSSR